MIQRHIAELDEGEVRVNEAFFAWRRGEPTPATAALDLMLIAWRQLEEGGELVLDWSATAADTLPRRSSRAARSPRSSSRR